MDERGIAARKLDVLDRYWYVIFVNTTYFPATLTFARHNRGGVA